MSSAIEQAVELLRQRNKELSAESAHISEAIRALTGNSAVSEPTPSNRPRKPRKSRKPRTRENDDKRVIDFLTEAGDWVSKGAVVDAIGMTPDRTGTILRDLEDAGKVNAKGVTRARRYKAVVREPDAVHTDMELGGATGVFEGGSQIEMMSWDG